RSRGGARLRSFCTREGSAAGRTSRSLTQPAVAKRVSSRAGDDAGRFARLILSPTQTRLAIVYDGWEADTL
ncbi:MAG TPA: hypothetical protein VFY59_17540, partial [Rubrobacter sp.]|nr:hypothetical protein [Rubrobacter sp.]